VLASAAARFFIEGAKSLRSDPINTVRLEGAWRGIGFWAVADTADSKIKQMEAGERRLPEAGGQISSARRSYFDVS